MNDILDTVAKIVRRYMEGPALFLHRVSGGRIKPNHVTLISLLGHFWIFQELMHDRPIYAAWLLLFFGLLDSLDGALARVQHSASAIGMLYDSVSDRVKEVLLFCGLAVFLQTNMLYSLIGTSLFHFYWQPNTSIEPWYWLPAAVLGMSLVVSYIRARGEAILQSQTETKQKANTVFTDGIARYEVRTAFIIFALFTGTLFWVLHILLILVTYTALQRLWQVRRALK